MGLVYWATLEVFHTQKEQLAALKSPGIFTAFMSSTDTQYQKTLKTH